MTHKITGRRWLPVLMTAWMAAALLLAGLASPVSPAAARQGTLLRVGYLGLPETDAAMGAQLAIDEINSLGGIAAPDGTTYTLELATLATAPTEATLPDAVTAFASQGVVAILGPDDNALLSEPGLAALENAGMPVLAGATNDTLTGEDRIDTLFRIRAPESVYSSALAAVMIEDLGLTSIALVHTDAASTPALLTFLQAMNGYEITPAAKVQLSESSRLLEETQALVDLNPEAVVMWGPHEDAATMLSVLRKRGWTGTFAYRDAQDAARAGAFEPGQADGVLGVTSWSYGYPGQTARVFLDDYISTFGAIPGPLSAASYDAMWYLRAAIQSAGVADDALTETLLAGAPLALVGGELHAAQLGTGELINVAMVYELGPDGGPTVLARFAGEERLAVETAN